MEAVRNALYKSAGKDNLFGEWQKYYGNGILKAYDALQIGVADESELVQAKDAETSWFGVVELVSSFFYRRKRNRSLTVKPEKESLASELLQLMQTDPQFYQLYDNLDLAHPAAIEALMTDEKFCKQVEASPYASPYLKEAV